MKDSKLIITAAAIIIVIVLGILLFRQKGKVGDTIKLGYKDGVGNYLADENGKTLYYFTKDQSDKSNCRDMCASNWPPFNPGNINVASSLEKDDFNVITREDGKGQVTYKGWPLYYYFNDANPNEINGEGKEGGWFILKQPFYSIMLKYKEGVGTYLIDSRGLALYYSANDKPGDMHTPPESKCAGDCVKKWPVFFSEELVAPSALNKDNFTVFSRGNEEKQLAYKGHPIYFYAEDKVLGDTKGDRVENVWLILKP